MVVGILLVAQAAMLPVAGLPSAEGDGTDSNNEWAAPDTLLGPQTTQQSEPSNDTTVRHRDPETVDQEGDLAQVSDHLTGKLSQRLGDSAIHLEQDEYDRARSVLGEEYDSDLEKFVTVAGDTDNQEAADSVEEATEQQRTFTNETEQYQNTREQYEQAKQEGDQQRARELARQLDRQAENVTQQGGALLESYESVESQTGTDLTEAKTATENVTRTVERQQAEIRAVEFTETRLQLSADREETSFLEPMTLDGHLHTANGTPVANETITLRVGQQHQQVETDASGEFSTVYRPRTVPLSRTTLAVAYLPDEASPYVGSNASVPMQINPQVTAEIDLDALPETAAYGDRIGVAGTVTAGNRTVAGIPVRVELGEIHVDTVRTDQQGSFDMVQTVPADLQTGEHSVVVAHTQTNRAVAAETSSTPITVTATETTLSSTAEQADEESVVVSGQLQTIDGAGVGGQPIEIRTAETNTTVVETNATGWYSATIPAEPDTTLAVEARFDDPSTNLAPSTATTQITLPPEEREVRESLVSFSAVWGIIGLTLIGLIGLGAWYSRRRRNHHSRQEPIDTPTSTTHTGSVDAQSVSLLDSAESVLEEDPNTAVTLAYGALRRALPPEETTAENLTHWEFYDTYRDVGADESDSLRRVTERYEQAAYGRGRVDQPTAMHALETARRLSEERR